MWQRTIACQMPDARGSTVTARIVATTSARRADRVVGIGRTITFPGYLAVYGYSGDDAGRRRRVAKLPELTEGHVCPHPTSRRRATARSRRPATRRRRS